MIGPPGGDVCTLAPSCVRLDGALTEGGRVPGQQQTEDVSPNVRIEVVDHLPQGRLVARVEAEHDTVFVVDEQGSAADFPTFLRQLEGVMQEAVESGTWERTPVHAPDHEQKPTPGGEQY